MTYKRFKELSDFVIGTLFGILPNEQYTIALYSQAKHETNGFTSKSYTQGNNLFGMKQSNKRVQYWKGSLLGHASYVHEIASIIDRIDWDVYNKIIFISTIGYIEKVLDKKYAEDKDYKIKWLNHIKNTINARNNNTTA